MSYLLIYKLWKFRISHMLREKKINKQFSFNVTNLILVIKSSQIYFQAKNSALLYYNTFFSSLHTWSIIRDFFTKFIIPLKWKVFVSYISWLVKWRNYFRFFVFKYFITISNFISDLHWIPKMLIIAQQHTNAFELNNFCWFHPL